MLGKFYIARTWALYRALYRALYKGYIGPYIGLSLGPTGCRWARRARAPPTQRPTESTFLFPGFVTSPQKQNH